MSRTTIPSPSGPIIPPYDPAHAGQPAQSPSQSSAPSATPAAATGPAIQRQFVNFAFYKLDPAFRRLSEPEKLAARDEFVKAANYWPKGMICLIYSTVAMRADVDFCLWRISASSDDFQTHQAGLNKTR